MTVRNDVQLLDCSAQAVKMNFKNSQMDKYKFLIIYLLGFVPFMLSGQRTISGYITDADDKEPVPGASVFISNTTIGTGTDANGYYQLRIPGDGSYRLTVSHVGYQAVFRDIDPGSSAIKFDVALQSIELDELTVATKVRFRQGDINLFWNKILGKNPSRRTIQATNPEAVYYYYNPDTRILKVTCREPLNIINYETGYQIQYVLTRFTHDYNTEMSDWDYYSVFTALEPSSARQQDSWEQKRKEVYQVSLTRLIKSLYNNSLRKDGFVLTTLTKPKSSVEINPAYIVLPNITGKSKRLNFLNNEMLLLCYGRPVTDYDLKALSDAQSREGGILSISSIEWERKFSGIIRNVLHSGVIDVFPDGTFINKFSISTIDASTPRLLGLSMSLPIEYATEVSIPLAIEIPSDENKNVFDDIAQHFVHQLSVFPQEKIHLHTDRDTYISGEKIWFKAYVADALTHQYPTDSRYVYVELISPVDTLMYRVMVRPTNDMFYGHLPLTEYVPTGNYTLRAYTRYMENLGDDYFFKKNIRIENLASPLNQQRPTASRGLLKEDYAISFFPEGGNLPEGILSKIAFKALNSNGYPETVTGKLIDENDVGIATVETFYAGMGVFEYIPEPGKRIWLKCKNIHGLEKQFELPQPSPQAYSLSAYSMDNELLIEVNHSVHAPDIPCFLLAHCRGALLYFSEWHTAHESVLFDTNEFPAGIIQFVLFDEQMNPLSERLVFSKNFTNDVATVEFQTDKAFYAKREKVSTILSLYPSLSGRAGVGLCSVAITDDKDITVDSTTTILSSLLLSSELKGYIENPASYLQDNPKSAIALDYLMMTHGWRRYNIPDIVKGNPKSPQIPFQTSQQISGMVKSPTSSRIIPESEITIMMKNGDYGIVSTDEKGTFIFNEFEYPDSTSFFIQALGKRNSNLVELVLDKETFPKLAYATQSPHLTPTVSKGEEIAKRETKSEADAFITKAEQRSRYDEDLWVIHLDEMVVTAPKIEKRDEPRLAYWVNESSDVTIRREEIERRHPLTVTDMLRNMAGVYVTQDGRIIIRRSSTLERTILPLVLIDGVRVPWVLNESDDPADESSGKLNNIYESPLELVHVNDVESIDVFTGPGAAVFGVNGFGGAISITTKKGGKDRTPERDKSNQTIYTPLGYQKPVEFYAPVYETLEAKHLTVPDFRTTIFWKPDVVISDEGEAKFEFYTSDFSTTYSVVIEGLTSDGRIIRQVEKIRVE